MFIVLLPLSLALLYCNWELKPDTNIKETLLKSILVFAFTLFCITETLSFFNQLNPTAIVISWSFVIVALIGRIYLKKELSFDSIKSLFRTVFGLRKKRGRMVLIGLILGLILTQGLVYPPNNWDSMTYHLPRITSWLGHESLEHYATHIIRQLYQPPFSEFALLHVRALSGSDLLLNSVQFLFWISSLLAILLLIEELAIPALRRVKYIAVILVLTIPEAILQATSTQNDIVVSFFILASIYFSIKALKGHALQYFLFLGVSIGLAVLTKGSAYVYLLPLIVTFAVVYGYNLLKLFSPIKILYPFLTALIFLVINTGHYSRNYALSGNLLGTEDTESSMYLTEDMTPQLVFSNMLKNAGLHMGPYPVNILYDKSIRALHGKLKIDINSAKTNFANQVYNGASDFPNDEDSAANPLHFWLILFVLFILLIRLIRRKGDSSKWWLFLFIIFFLQIYLFCHLLRWQPWHTRLQLPLFFVAIPLIVYALSLKKVYLKRVYFMLPTFVFYGFLVILFNFSRPIISSDKTAEISIFDSREKKYFSKKPFLYQEYAQMSASIETSTSHKVGIIIGADEWEYPLFNAFGKTDAIPVHIYMGNYSTKMLTGEDIDCIVSTSVNDSSIGYNGIEYQNQTSANQHVWFYK